MSYIDNHALTSKDFIGRKELMWSIHSAIMDIGKIRVFNIQGEGGIGKTSVLREVGIRYKHQNMNELIVTEIIDFFDISARTRRGFMLRLFDELNLNYKNEQLIELFQNFEQAWDEFSKVEISGAGAEFIREKRDELVNKFQKFYSILSIYYRLIIRIDTFELIQHIYGNWISNFISQLRNTVVLIAGRENEAWNSVIKTAVGEDNVIYYELKEFNKDDTRELFNLSSAGKSVDNEEREKLWLLSKGKPVLLTLALDWRDRLGITRKSLTEVTSKYSLHQLENKSAKELADIREEFNAELVSRFVNSDFQLNDNAICLMSIIYKNFTADMMSYFLGIEKEKADSVLRNISEWTFMKFQRRGDTYQLHDLIRDLIVEYVWPKIDATGQLRQKYYKKALAYYEMMIHEKEKEIGELQKEKNIAEDTGNHKILFQIINRSFRLRRKKRLFEVQKTYYDLMCDYEHALIRYRYFFVDLVWAREKGFYDIIREERANACAMIGKNYPEAQELLEDVMILIVSEGQFDEGLKILKEKPFIDIKEEDDPILCALVFLYSGIALIYKGDTVESEIYLEKSIEILKKCEMKSLVFLKPEDIKSLPINRVLARAFTNLGYMNLSSFKFTKAKDAYKQAIYYADRSYQKALSAAIKNDLAYIYARFGKADVARKLCKDALRVRNKLGQVYFIGLSYSVLGQVEYFHRKYEAGLRYADIARSIFERIGDLRGLALSYRGLGANSGALGKVRKSIQYFEKSESYLEKSLELFTEKYIQPEPTYLIQIYEYLGLLYQDWGATLMRHDLSNTLIVNYNEKAENYFKQAISLAADKQYVWAEVHLLERLFSFYFKYLKKRDSETLKLLTRIENILYTKLPSYLLLLASQKKPIPLKDTRIKEKEYIYVLGRFYRGKARIAYSDFLEKRSQVSLKFTALFYVFSCAFMEYFARDSYGIEITLNEITTILEQMNYDEIDNFQNHVIRSLKDYNLENYSMILERIEDYSGLV